MIETNEKVDDVCCICLDKIKEKAFKDLQNNGHHFHKKCIQKYLTQNEEEFGFSNCPLCRYGPTEDDIKKICRIKESMRRYSTDSEYSYGY